MYVRPLLTCGPMRTERVRPYVQVGLLSRLLALVVGVALMVLAPSAASAQEPDAPDSENYPPNAVVNLLDPFGCEPASISGEIGAVFPGSTITLELLINGASANTISVTAGDDGTTDYTIPVPPGQYGPAIVRATGTLWLQEINEPGDPFSLDTAGTITECPPDLPKTGGSSAGTWVTIGLAAVLAGGLLVVMSTRRRQRTGEA